MHIFISAESKKWTPCLYQHRHVVYCLVILHSLLYIVLYLQFYTAYECMYDSDFCRIICLTVCSPMYALVLASCCRTILTYKVGLFRPMKVLNYCLSCKKVYVSMRLSFNHPSEPGNKPLSKISRVLSIMWNGWLLVREEIFAEETTMAI